MESRVDCFLCRWKRSQGGSGEGMKTTIKCEDCNEALGFTPKQNCFYEFRHIYSIFIYSGGIWLDCGCVMCILKRARLWARTRLPAKGYHLSVKPHNEGAWLLVNPVQWSVPPFWIGNHWLTWSILPTRFCFCASIALIITCCMRGYVSVNKIRKIAQIWTPSLKSHRHGTDTIRLYL